MAYQNIVILTGAGISAESGISTFRDEGGLWAKHAIEDVATPEAFQRNPKLVQEFYSARRAQLADVYPNEAHKALARLQHDFTGHITLVTQNVDDLHERAGFTGVIHMHGELRKVKCLSCGAESHWEVECTTHTPCPVCGDPQLRPDIVWFGEMPYHMELIYDRLRAADLFISIGTSGNVYPAAGFVSEVRRFGLAHAIEVNLEPSAGASLFHEQRNGRAGDLLPVLVDEILSDQ